MQLHNIQLINMNSQSNKLMVAKSVLSTLGSAAAAAMVARSVVNDFLPYEVRDYLFSSLHSIFNRRLSSDITLIIEEFEGLEINHIFEAVEVYIGARTKTMSSSTSASRLKVRKPDTAEPIQVNVDRNEEVEDEFEGVKFKWLLNCHHVESRNYHNPRDLNATLRSEFRAFHLRFHKKFRDIALEKYLPHIIKEAEFLKQVTKTVKLFTVDPNNLYGNFTNAWTPINLNHPSTFDTVAMDAGLKEMVMEDLGRFVRRREYYRRVGKAWKRGYLLYGPPGTGKSSLIAAIANYMKFDIYDLEISGLRLDSELRKALLGTASKSIIVVEDIDCAVDFNDRESHGDGAGAGAGCHHDHMAEDKVTLSGLLNFIDGLWSTCGDERIIIFTTNHKDKLDPALLRPGRMDLHIHMSYCTPSGFNLLADNYLGIKHHELFTIIETMIEQVEVTPAEVAEQLMRHDDPDRALNGLVDFLELKKVENASAQDRDIEVKEFKSKVSCGGFRGMRGGRSLRGRRALRRRI